ncbi:MAG: dienelactone hydrolase family protein [Actinomycetota bacterium]|nr:dienelactone hydrolase family protein [Actinomycetota bacterium]
MWNAFRTDGELSLQADIITFPGGGGDPIHAYYARPTGDSPMPALVFMHHMPGFDEFTFEAVERLARHGYRVVCPDLYCRFGHGSPDDVAATARSNGGVADDSVVADAEAALAFLHSSAPTTKVGVLGPCSGGRHALLVASRVPGFSAVADLWGGGVIAGPEELTAQRPVAVIDYSPELDVPLLGLFGNEDSHPSPEQVDHHEAELRRLGKDYEFHRYDGAGHGFIYYHTPMYRPEQAMDAWSRIFGFFGDKLGA